MLPPNLKTGVTANLPGDYKRQPTAAPAKALAREARRAEAHKLNGLFALVWLQHCRGKALRYHIESEYQFDAERQWRFDFAFPAELVAIELDGGIHSHGAHVRGQGYQRDREKDRAAILAGWTVLRFPADDLQRDPFGVVRIVEKALGMRGAK